MSGFKRATVSISQEEYDRLREAEHQLRNLPKPASETKDRIAKESQSYFRAAVQDVQQRQAALQDLVNGMSEYVRDLEQNTSQALIEFEANTIGEFESYAGSLCNYFNQIISDYSSHYEELIVNYHRQYQHELGILGRQMRRMAGSQRKKYLYAYEWLNAAEQLAAFIRENYAWSFFLPGRFERLEQQLAQTRQNLDLGFSEAVIAASQQLYFAFSDLRVELERLENEWQIAYTAVRETIEQETHLIESCRLVQAVDLDGNPLDYWVDVDYWTHGRLSQLMNSIDNYRSQFENDLQLPQTETLIQWLSNDLPELHRQLENIVLDARIAALNSQLRINIADLVVRALREQGFSLSNADYEANDMRLGYDVQLTNLEGCEVVVEVSPVGETIGDNELSIISHDKDQRTEHELVRRWLEISESLSAYGLDVGKYTTAPTINAGIPTALPAVRTIPERTKQARNNRRAR